MQCPFDGCHYEVPDVDPVLAAAFLTAHAMVHRTQGPAMIARVETVRRPDITSAGTTEDWVYFKSRWSD